MHGITHDAPQKEDLTNFLKVSRQFDPHTQLVPDEESILYKPSFVQRALSVPFAPTWAFGVDILTKFKNLTTSKSNYRLFYTVSHVGIIYSHTTNDMQFLMGHRNLITSISADESGKWLVTADNDKDNSIIIWDSDDCFPVRTIFDPHPDVGVSEITISHDARFIVSIGAEPESVIKFWLWTYGNDEADGTFIAKASYGEPKFINFNPNDCTHFAVTFSEAIIFFTWNSKKLVEWIGEIPHTKAKNYGFYTDTTYIPYSHECLSVTTNGWAIVWGLTFFTVPYDSMPDNNHKIFLKAIRLQRDGISSICYVDGVISTTDFRGNIRFYDDKLKILYFCHKFSLPSIIMTGFNLGQRKFIVQDPTVLDSYRTQSEKVEETQETKTEVVETAEKLKMKDKVESTEEKPESVIQNEQKMNDETGTVGQEINEETGTVEQKNNEETGNVEQNINEETGTVEQNINEETGTVEQKMNEEQKIVDETGAPQGSLDDDQDQDNHDEMDVPKMLDDSENDHECDSDTSVNKNEEKLGTKIRPDETPDVEVLKDEEEEMEEKPENFVEEDRSEEYEKIYINLLPSDFTLQRSPFLVRDYIILTKDGQFAYVDAVENKLDFFLSTNYSPITAMDVHYEKPVLILGYANGCVYTYNYEECRLIVKRTLMNSKDEQNNVISSVRYSPQGLFLVCGTAGGHLWFLDPVTVKPVKPYDKKPFMYERSKIVDIQFSSDNRYLAYYDISKAVCLLKRKEFQEDDENPEWVFHGRIIAHKKHITGMLFCEPSRLFTISKDKHMVEYYVKDSQPGKLGIISRIPIMQRGYPLAFTTYDIMCENGSIYFLVSTNEYKYLIINEENSTLERTILAPFFGKPVHCLKVIPNKENKYIMFSTAKYLGIQMLPISGNPYKQVTLIAHSSYIEHFRISKCGKHVFTIGRNDNVCIMWAIRSESVEYMLEQGGRQLSPYYALIEGGSEGWLFQEIKDLFYYMQILHQGEDSPFQRQVSDKIPISELPNLMRAIGYYPTEFELDNILYEVKYHYAENSTNEDEEEEINFLNFLKLYINHRPVKSFNKNEVKWAFNKLANQDGIITKKAFTDIMCTKGEPFTKVALNHCLSILSNSTGELLPEEITYEYFMSEILGVENREFY